MHCLCTTSYRRRGAWASVGVSISASSSDGFLLLTLSAAQPLAAKEKCWLRVDALGPNKTHAQGSTPHAEPALCAGWTFARTCRPIHPPTLTMPFMLCCGEPS